MICCPHSTPQMYDVLESASHIQDCSQGVWRAAQRGSAACSTVYTHLPIWCYLSNTLYGEIDPPKAAGRQHSRAEVLAADLMGSFRSGLRLVFRNGSCSHTSCTCTSEPCWASQLQSAGQDGMAPIQGPPGCAPAGC